MLIPRTRRNFIRFNFRYQKVHKNSYNKNATPILLYKKIRQQMNILKLNKLPVKKFNGNSSK